MSDETTAEYQAREPLAASLQDFLERLGRTVERTSDSRLVARHRTALIEEERKFNVVQESGDRFLKTATNVVAPGVPLPDDPNEYPDTVYFHKFLDRTVQAGRIAESIINDKRINEEREFFVPQRLQSDGTALDLDSVSFFRRWLNQPGSRLLAILAPAGYGKTALTCQMSHELATDYLAQDPESKDPFPYLVPFGEFRRLASFEAMILSSLQRKGITDYTANAFAYLVERRRVALMLDGFDELLEERPEEARKNLRELIETLQGQGKVVVTARSTFFRTSDEVADFLEYYLDPEQVEVVELAPFDKHQRARVIQKRFPTQAEIRHVTRFIEADNVREAMGSPLLLRETIDALSSAEEEARLDRTAGRRDLFTELERSVYARERLRHGHLFSDDVQRLFLQRLAEALLTDNARGFDFELVEVLAHEAADDSDESESALAQLADHHFLTVDHESDEARFNHQVFREYFQARAIVKACEKGSSSWIDELLAHRPVPEEVCTFLAELDRTQHLPKQLLGRITNGVRPSERLVANLGSLVAAYSDDALLRDFVTAVPPDVGLGFEVSRMDLSGASWSDRFLMAMKFTGCKLTEADFKGSVISDLTLTQCDLTGADFRESEIESLVLDGGPRIFGRPDAFEALSQVGANCGLKSKAVRRTVEQTREQQLLQMIYGRLYRFYRPGQAGPEGSRWDSSIQEKNLLGGVPPVDRKFVIRKLLPALRSAGLLERRRAHGEVIYDLTNDGEDDARALIERNDVVGRVREALEALT